MPSPPVPEPVIFEPTEGRTRGTTDDLPLKAALTGVVPYDNSCQVPFQLARRPGSQWHLQRAPEHKSSRRPRRTPVGNLADYVVMIEGIKGSAAVCRRCILNMLRYSTSSTAKAFGAGKAVVPGARPIQATSPDMDTWDKVKDTAWTRDGYLRELLRPKGTPGLQEALATALGLPEASKAGEEQPNKHSQTFCWVCPHCCVNYRGDTHRGWEYYVNNVNKAPLYFAHPYTTTHLLVTTGKVIPPIVSHLSLDHALRDMRERVSRSNWRRPPRTTGDVPGTAECEPWNWNP